MNVTQTMAQSVCKVVILPAVCGIGPNVANMCRRVGNVFRLYLYVFTWINTSYYKIGCIYNIILVFLLVCFDSYCGLILHCLRPNGGFNVLFQVQSVQFIAMLIFLGFLKTNE